MERERACFYGDIGCDWTALSLPTLRAMTNLNRREWSSNGEADTSAEARSLVFDGHRVLMLPNVWLRGARYAVPGSETNDLPRLLYAELAKNDH